MNEQEQKEFFQHLPVWLQVAYRHSPIVQLAVKQVMHGEIEEKALFEVLANRLYDQNMERPRRDEDRFVLKRPANTDTGKQDNYM